MEERHRLLEGGGSSGKPHVTLGGGVRPDSFFSGKSQPLRPRQITGLAYFCAAALNGGVLLLTSLTMDNFAGMLGTEVSKLSNLWLAKAFGSACALALSGTLFERDQTSRSHFIMGVAGSVLGIACFSVPCFMVSGSGIHKHQLLVIYFFFGATTAIIDVGITATSRRIQGDEAGLWLSGNTTAFSFGCEIVLVLQWLLKERFVFYTCAYAAVLIALGMFASACLPDPIQRTRSLPLLCSYSEEEPSGRSGSSGPLKIKVAFTNFFEWMFAICIFCTFGVKIATSQLLFQFGEWLIDDGTFSAIEYDRMILTVWTTCLIARMAGIVDQSFISFEAVFKVFLRAITSVALALVCAALLSLEGQHVTVFWLTMIGYFTAAGPTLGYIYDANCRITEVDSRGAAILKFGFHMGSSFVPYLTDKLWSAAGPIALEYSLAFCALLPLLVLLFVRRKVKNTGIYAS